MNIQEFIEIKETNEDVFVKLKYLKNERLSEYINFALCSSYISFSKLAKLAPVLFIGSNPILGIHVFW